MKFWRFKREKRLRRNSEHRYSQEDLLKSCDYIEIAFHLLLLRNSLPGHFRGLIWTGVPETQASLHNTLCTRQLLKAGYTFSASYVCLQDDYIWSSVTILYSLFSPFPQSLWTTGEVKSQLNNLFPYVINYFPFSLQWCAPYCSPVCLNPSLWPTCIEPGWFGEHAKTPTALTNTLKAHGSAFCKSVHGHHCVTVASLLNFLSIPLLTLNLSTQLTSAAASQGASFQVLWCSTWSWQWRHCSTHTDTHNHHIPFLKQFHWLSPHCICS